MRKRAELIHPEGGSYNVGLGLDIYCLAGTVKELEDPNDIKHLEEQLSDMKLLLKYNTGKHVEAQAFVQSLAGLEEACYNFFSSHLPDIIWEGKFSEEEYKARFDKIVDDLQLIKKYISQSKYLNKLVNGENGKK